MFINMAVRDHNAQQVKDIHRLLAHLSVKHDCDITIKWLSSSDADGSLPDLAASLHLALISLDSKNAAEFGLDLFNKNPDCLILFYKQGKHDLEFVLNSRPIAFQNCATSENFEYKILSLWQTIWENEESFRCQTKTLQCLIPFRQILFFESDLKQVLVHLQSGAVLRFYRKLDEIESEINHNLFIRVHQSFLVNRNHILYINRSDHTISLSNAKSIFISKYYYEKLVEALEDDLAPA